MNNMEINPSRLILEKRILDPILHNKHSLSRSKMLIILFQEKITCRSKNIFGPNARIVVNFDSNVFTVAPYHARKSTQTAVFR